MMPRRSHEHANHGNAERAVEEKCPTAEVLAHEVETYYEYDTDCHKPPENEWRAILGQIYREATWDKGLPGVEASVTKWWEHIVLELRKAERRRRELFPEERARKTFGYLLNWFFNGEGAHAASQSEHKVGTRAHAGGMTPEKLNALRLRKMMVSLSLAGSSLLQA